MSRVISHVPRLPILAAGIAAGGTGTETDVLLERVLASLDSPQTYTDPEELAGDSAAQRPAMQASVHSCIEFPGPAYGHCMNPVALVGLFLT